MSIPELHRRTRLIGAIQDATFEADFVPRLVRATADAVGGLGGSMWAVDAHAELAGVDYSTITQPDALADYRRNYSHLNPILPRAMAVMRPGDVSCGADFMPLKEYVRTRFYNEHVRTLGYVHEIGVLLEARSDLSAMLFAAREPRAAPFTTSDRRLLREVAPQMRNALALNRRVTDAQRSELAHHLLAERGWCGWSAEGGLLFYEGRIVERLCESGMLRIERDRLAWKSRPLQVRFDGLMAGLVSGTLRAPQTLTVHLAPFDLECEFVRVEDSHVVGSVRVRVLLLFRMREKPELQARARLASQHRLTQAEAGVALHMLQGRSMRETATAEGIAYETARSHAKSIYAKTSSRSRAEFMARALNMGDSLDL